MKRRWLLAFCIALLVVLAATPAMAYHWHYYHPLWGLGYWPHFAGPFYPPATYVTPPPIVIQQQPQTYIQRPPEQAQPPQVVWHWCRKPEGFWPHVQKCEHDAWMQVLPQTAPPTAPR